MGEFELIELLGAALGKMEDEIEEMHEDLAIAEALTFNEFDIDLEAFSKIAALLLKLCPVVETAVTGAKFHAFVKDGIILARTAAYLHAPPQACT